jgi:hypothetical protein
MPNPSTAARIAKSVSFDDDPAIHRDLPRLTVALKSPLEHDAVRRTAVLNAVVPDEIIGRSRRAPPCKVRRCADHGHSHRPYYPNSDHVRRRPVFWTDPGIVPLRDNIARRRVGVDLELDIGKSIESAPRWAR